MDNLFVAINRQVIAIFRNLTSWDKERLIGPLT